MSSSSTTDWTAGADASGRMSAAERGFCCLRRDRTSSSSVRMRRSSGGCFRRCSRPGPACGLGRDAVRLLYQAAFTRSELRIRSGVELDARLGQEFEERPGAGALADPEHLLQTRLLRGPLSESQSNETSSS